MNAVIIEDEELTAERLENLVKAHTDIQILTQLHSVKAAKKWLSENQLPDLIFLDIQLGDGSGFDVLDSFDTFPHIIFTTAFDQYAIDAFKYNSVDYLLKPIKPKDLENAVAKLKKINQSSADLSSLVEQIKGQITKTYKEKFLVKLGLKYHTFHTSEIAYFYSEEGESYLKTNEGKTSIIDHTLDNLENLLDPNSFFRVNRHMIIKTSQIVSIDSYFNNRLSLELNPSFHEKIIVSRDRVKNFKKWLGE